MSRTRYFAQLVLLSAGFIATPDAFAATAIHHYTFNNGSVTDSVGTANGILENGATVSSGRVHFDGVDDYVQFSQHLVPSLGSYSVSFFAQEIVPKANYAEMISQGFSSGPGFYLGYDQSRNIRVTDNFQNTGLPFPSDGLLHHYAVTEDTTGTRLYIDGSLRRTFGTMVTTTGGSDTRLGNQFTDYSEYFGGDIADLWVFNGALSATEVAALATVPEPSSILLAGIGLMMFLFQYRLIRRASSHRRLGHR